MKKIIAQLLLAVILLLPVTTFSTGCNTGLPPAQAAVAVEYKALSSVINVVELARTVYSDLYKQGKVPQDLDDKVLIIYTEYQRVGNQAIAVAKAQAAAANAGTPLMTDNIFIPQLQALVNQLLELFTKAGTPPQPQVVILKNAGV